jgi:hypothetical protein
MGTLGSRWRPGGTSVVRRVVPRGDPEAFGGFSLQPGGLAGAQEQPDASVASLATGRRTITLGGARLTSIDYHRCSIYKSPGSIGHLGVELPSQLFVFFVQVRGLGHRSRRLLLSISVRQLGSGVSDSEVFRATWSGPPPGLGSDREKRASSQTRLEQSLQEGSSDGGGDRCRRQIVHVVPRC